MTSRGLEAAPSREQILKATRDVFDQIHGLRLRSMQELGSIREVDRVLARTLMAEFSRVHLIVQEDLAKSLEALRENLRTSSAALISDLVKAFDLSPIDPRLGSLKASLHKFQRSATLQIDLPLAGLEAAREELTGFMCNRLQELGSQDESRDLIRELSSQLTAHADRVWELMQDPNLATGEVSR